MAGLTLLPATKPNQLADSLSIIHPDPQGATVREADMLVGVINVKNLGLVETSDTLPASRAGLTTRHSVDLVQSLNASDRRCLSMTKHVAFRAWSSHPRPRRSHQR